MPQTVDSAIKQAVFETDDTDYIMIRLSANGIMAAAGVVAQIGEPFAVLIADRHEVTLIIPAEVVEDYAPRLRNHEISTARYRLLTLDVVLEPTLIGFMARIAGTLADAGISVMPFAAYNRDHLLVPTDKFDAALQALSQLQSRL